MSDLISKQWVFKYIESGELYMLYFVLNNVEEWVNNVNEMNE